MLVGGRGHSVTLLSLWCLAEGNRIHQFWVCKTNHAFLTERHELVRKHSCMKERLLVLLAITLLLLPLLLADQGCNCNLVVCVVFMSALLAIGVDKLF